MRRLLEWIWNDLFFLAVMFLVFVLLCFLATPGHAQNSNLQCTVEQDTQTLSVSGGTLTFADACGTQTDQFELVPNGTSTSFTASVVGVGVGGTITPALASTGTNAAQILTVTGGPYKSYHFTAVWSGGTITSVTVYRIATTAQQHGLSPFWIGPINPTPAAPICVTGNSHTPTIVSCINWFNAMGTGNGGVIFAMVIEDITSQIFGKYNGYPWQGTVYLAPNTGNGTGCGQNVPPNCWTTEVPLSMGNHLVIQGLGGQGWYGNNTIAGGSSLTTGPNFPAGLGPMPTQVSITCASTGGYLSNGTYWVQAALVRNGYGGLATPLTPLMGGPMAGDATVTCSNGTSTQAITVTWNSLPAQGTAGTGYTATWGPYDLAVFSSCNSLTGGSVPSGTNYCAGSGGVSGQYLELENDNSTDMTCPNGAGVVDLHACRLGAGGSLAVVITGQNAAGNWISQGDMAAPWVDLSSPIIMEHRGPTKTNLEQTIVRNLTVECNPDESSVNTGLNGYAGGSTLDGYATLAFLNNGGQDQSGAEGMIVRGGCPTFWYTRGNNSHYQWLEDGSGMGPSTGVHYSMIIDSRGYQLGTRSIKDSSFSSRCLGCGGVTVTTPAMILVMGASQYAGGNPGANNGSIDFSGIHSEGRTGDAMQVTLGASVFLSRFDALSGANNTGVVHFTSTANGGCVMGVQGGRNTNNFSVVDDNALGGGAKVGALLSPYGTLPGVYCTHAFFGTGFNWGGLNHFPYNGLVQSGGDQSAVTATTCCTLWKSLQVPQMETAQVYTMTCPDLPIKYVGASALLLGVEVTNNANGLTSFTKLSASAKICTTNADVCTTAEEQQTTTSGSWLTVLTGAASAGGLTTPASLTLSLEVPAATQHVAPGQNLLTLAIGTAIAGGTSAAIGQGGQCYLVP